MSTHGSVRGFAPFVQIPKWIFTLGPYSVAVYGALSCYADENGGCFPSVAALAERAGVSERKCQSVLRDLEQRGCIEITNRTRANGSTGSSLYDIRPAWGVQEVRPGGAGGAPLEGDSRDRDLLSEANASDGVSDDQGLPFTANDNGSLARTDARTPAPAREERPDVDRVSAALEQHVVEQTNRAPTAGVLWRRDLRLMLDRDGVSEEEALRIIAWLRSPGGARFWARNILSAKKLRVQFPRLILEAGARQGIDTSLAARQERAAAAIAELQAQGR